MSVYKFLENFTPNRKAKLIELYNVIYGVEVFEGEDNTITTTVDGETIAVTEEFLRSVTRRGRYITTTIDELGVVVTTRDYVADDTLVHELGGPLQRSVFASDEEYYEYLFRTAPVVDIGDESDSGVESDLDLEEGNEVADEL